MLYDHAQQIKDCIFALSVLNKATGQNLYWQINKTETENLFIVNKVENEEREVQDVIDEVGKLYNPLLDDLDMDTLMEDNMDSESVSKTGCKA